MSEEKLLKYYGCNSLSEFIDTYLDCETAFDLLRSQFKEIERLNNLNEQLVEECQKQEDIITNLQERIDKAKEYIENNLWSDYGDRCEVSKKEIFQILEGDKK